MALSDLKNLLWMWLTLPLTALDLGLLCGVLLVATVVGALGMYQRPSKSTAVTVGVTCVSGFVFLVLNWVLWAHQVP